MNRLIRCTALALILAPAIGVAQNVDGGMTDQNTGAYATALPELTALAEKGDAQAQFRLGFRYYRGESVPKDDVEAVKW